MPSLSGQFHFWLLLGCSFKGLPRGVHLIQKDLQTGVFEFEIEALYEVPVGNNNEGPYCFMLN